MVLTPKPHYNLLILKTSHRFFNVLLCVSKLWLLDGMTEKWRLMPSICSHTSRIYVPAVPAKTELRIMALFEQINDNDDGLLKICFSNYLLPCSLRCHNSGTFPFEKGKKTTRILIALLGVGHNRVWELMGMDLMRKLSPMWKQIIHLLT